jgi:quinol monooxygenase YgiN
MTTINKGDDVVTLINVFTVEPEHQQHLVDLLVEATEAVMKRQPGFVSANIHKSLDGTHVANYAQWKSREEFEAIFSNPEVIPHMQNILTFAKADGHLYEVSYTHETAD